MFLTAWKVFIWFMFLDKKILLFWRERKLAFGWVEWLELTEEKWGKKTVFVQMLLKFVHIHLKNDIF